MIFRFIDRGRITAVFDADFAYAKSFSVSHAICRFPNDERVHATMTSPSVREFAIRRDSFTVNVFQRDERISDERVIRRFMFEGNDFYLYLFYEDDDFFYFFAATAEYRVARRGYNAYWWC